MEFMQYIALIKYKQPSRGGGGTPYMDQCTCGRYSLYGPVYVWSVLPIWTSVGVVGTPYMDHCRCGPRFWPPFLCWLDIFETNLIIFTPIFRFRFWTPFLGFWFFDHLLFSQYFNLYDPYFMILNYYFYLLGPIFAVAPCIPNKILMSTPPPPPPIINR